MEYISVSGIARSIDTHIYFNFCRHCHVPSQKDITNPITGIWMSSSMCMFTKTDVYLSVFNSISLMSANWYIMSTCHVVFFSTYFFHFSTSLSFSSFKYSMHAYVSKPFVFCITNSFSKSIILFFLVYGITYLNYF